MRIFDNDSLRHAAEISGCRVEAGYKEPGDLPIPFSATDPLSGDALYGDDEACDDQLRRGRTFPGNDHSGRPEKPSKKKEAATPEDMKLKVQLTATQILAEDPRFQSPIWSNTRTPSRGNRKVHQQAIAILAAGLRLGIPYPTLSDLMFGDHEPITPDLVGAYGFDDVEGYMTGSAVVQGPMDEPQESELADRLLREWSAAKAQLTKLQKEIAPVEAAEKQTRSMIGSIMENWEDKIRTVDGVLYEYDRQKDRQNVAYAKVLERVYAIVNDDLKTQIDALKQEFASFTRMDIIKIKGKEGRRGALTMAEAMKLAQQKQADDLAQRRMVNAAKAIDQTLSQIVAELEAAGLTGQMQRAAARRAPVEQDWLGDLVIAQVGGFKDGDQVQDQDGKTGTATVTPDGKLSVQYADGGTAVYDDAAVNGGSVKRSTKAKPRQPMSWEKHKQRDLSPEEVAQTVAWAKRWLTQRDLSPADSQMAGAAISHAVNALFNVGLAYVDRAAYEQIVEQLEGPSAKMTGGPEVPKQAVDDSKPWQVDATHIATGAKKTLRFATAGEAHIAATKAMQNGFRVGVYGPGRERGAPSKVVASDDWSAEFGAEDEDAGDSPESATSTDVAGLRA